MRIIFALKIYDFVLHFQPMAISMDFEIAVFQAAQFAFPGTQIL